MIKKICAAGLSISLLFASFMPAYADEGRKVDQIDFEAQRLILSEQSDVAEELGSVSYDNESGVYFADFDSETETADAYNEIIDEIGEENVLIDLPMSVAATGWGTAYMEMEDDVERINQETGKKVVVALIDSGINISHEIFKGKTISPLSKSFIDTDPSNITDENGHGTGMAGVVAESTPNCVELMILKIVDESGNCKLSNFQNAVKYAVDNGADIINASLTSSLSNFESTLAEGGFTIEQYFQALDKTLASAESSGVTICAASGNDGDNYRNLVVYPACSSHVICVGATNKQGKRPALSNYGDGLDFAAPGQAVSCADCDESDSYTSLTGTSVSTAYISSAAAILECRGGAVDLSTTMNALQEIAVDVQNEGYDIYSGYGIPVFSEQHTYTVTFDYNDGTGNKSNVVCDKGDAFSFPQAPSRDGYIFTGWYLNEDQFIKDPYNANEDITLIAGWEKKPVEVTPTPVVTPEPTAEPTVTPTPQPTVTPTETPEPTVTLKDVSGASVVVSGNYTYSGAEMTPDVKVYYDGAKIYANADYTVSYKNNKNAGNASVLIQGKGNFTGSLTKSFRILPASISNCTVSGITNKIYTGAPVKCNIGVQRGSTALREGEDYTVSYGNNKDVGTATVTITGIGNYTGSLVKRFNITQKHINPTIKISKSSFVYNGNMQKPSVCVYDSGRLLDPKAYTVKYTGSCRNAGTYEVKVTLKGNYTGNGTTSFTIRKANNPLTVKTKTKSIKSNKIKKRYNIKAAHAFKIRNAAGTISYRKISGNKKISISKNGKITVRKGVKKGTYKIKVKVMASGNSNYNPANKVVTAKIKVK